MGHAEALSEIRRKVEDDFNRMDHPLSPAAVTRQRRRRERVPGARRLRRELILLGTGTSVGVPVIGCRCPVCTSSNPRNHRTRTGVFVPAPEGNFLIDTPPELRLQLLREKVELVHAAIFTHSHADHIFGLDDLRIFGYRLDRDIGLYCEEIVERQIRAAFSYAFAPADPDAAPFRGPEVRHQADDDRAVYALGPDDPADPPDARQAADLGLPPQRRRLLHRRQRHPR